MSRYAVRVREWSVAGLGAGLLAVSASYFAVDGSVATSEYVRFAIPIALSLFVVALGLWLRAAELPADLVCVVFLWSFTGSVVMGLLTGWISLLQSFEGRPMLQPASIVLTKVALGALGGGLLGAYYTRLQQRTDELAEQRNRLDEFASIVSHDLRNPMNVAQGHLELARETGEDRHFEAVEDAHGRMERLVDEVLALSRRGEMVDDVTPVNLRVVAEEAWDTVETPGMDLRVETDRRVVSDDRRLRALFENLFRNAVDHGGETVTVGATDEGFYVADDGPGIPPEDRELVFEGGYSTHPDGTGFGLAIVRRIAEAHDWQIRVTEGDSGGAHFEFVGVDRE
ncbi:HAMP domain-containing sensor histidine kinase [Halorussus sp. MSC15.2]|uniref:sensor histidine kinase n=1 Tax=Halorussus sp. MSC15.2 TaxID=2283638 RepID=UPI0013D5E76C|nr:HAMP domain-containing sensor histidine kinase [Halorussus sp. MSC15.2]NEU56972.1 HAMP domain-containing histidine kinase [Halorussus sp. MSC15.2]